MIELEPAWVLHTRDYRETSLLVDLFALRAGRCRVIAKGARRGKRNQRALLQAFRPLLVSAVGHGELRTLTAVEDSGPPTELAGVTLACGLYLNELVLSLLPPGDTAAEVFAQYSASLSGLASDASAGPPLRAFELALLEYLGLAPTFDVVSDTGLAVDAGAELGVNADGVVAGSADPVLCRAPGAALLALARRDHAVHRGAQRRVLHALLQGPLGHKPLRSRDLLNQFRGLAESPGLASPQPPESESDD
ncbi:MAG: DNA repair protein RecO [Pseudomonadota bacterium]